MYNGFAWINSRIQHIISLFLKAAVKLTNQNTKKYFFYKDKNTFKFNQKSYLRKSKSPIWLIILYYTYIYIYIYTDIYNILYIYVYVYISIYICVSDIKCVILTFEKFSRMLLGIFSSFQCVESCCSILSFLSILVKCKNNIAYFTCFNKL